MRITTPHLGWRIPLQVYQWEPRSQDDWGFTQSQVWRVCHLHTQLTSHPRLAFTCPTLLVSDCDLHQLEPFARAPMWRPMSLLLSFTKSCTLITLVSSILPWVHYLHYTYLYSFINTYQLTIIVVLITVNPYNLVYEVGDDKTTAVLQSPTSATAGLPWFPTPHRSGLLLSHSGC